MGNTPTFRIKHVLPRQDALGWVATYALDSAPFAAILPVLYFAVVGRGGNDEIAGFITDGRVIIADRPPLGSSFLGYQNINGMNQEQINEYFARLVAHGEHVANGGGEEPYLEPDEAPDESEDTEESE